MDTKNNTYINRKTGFIKYVLSFISSLRVIFAPVFFYTFINDLILISLILFLILSLTDVLDAYIARKYEVSSNKGAYFDVISDIFMFLQFILTSKLKMPVYDPLGKYFGTILFGGAIITLIFNNLYLYDAITLFVLIFATMSLLSHYIFLFLRWRKSKRSE